jgi:uncharacterized protein with beta-barrel porin domain
MPTPWAKQPPLVRSLATTGDRYKGQLQYRRCSEAEAAKRLTSPLKGCGVWRPLVGIGLSRYSGLLGIGLDATLSTQTTLQFGYNYEIGQSDHAQMLSARLHMAF